MGSTEAAITSACGATALICGALILPTTLPALGAALVALGAGDLLYLAVRLLRGGLHDDQL